MHIAQREFGPEILDRITKTVRERADLTRYALARLVCGWVGWADTAGRAKESSCRALLVKLERRGLIELPVARAVNFAEATPDEAAAPQQWPQIKAKLAALGKVELVVVNGDRALSRVWRAMMRGHHPLSDGPLCGAQLRYLIRSERGWLGGLSFSSAAWRLKERDKWIGWSEATRRARLDRIVQNSRFLILPTVEVSNLASHVLGLAMRQLAHDWRQRYGQAPVLVETFVDSSRYKGTCYRAANWIELGFSQGRGRQDRGRQQQVAPKHVFVYELQPQCRETLTVPLELPRLLPVQRTRPPADWAEEEFGRCRLSAPLTQRLMGLARDFWARPMAPLTQACGSATNVQAAYRFMDHEDVQFETILQPHYAATEARISELGEGSVVLVAQDTTSLNYNHLEIEGIGPIGSTQDGAQGLLLHSGLGLTEQGVPLGFLDAKCWARDPEEFGQSAERKAWPVEDKESYRWIESYRAVAAVQKRNPHIRLVSVGDREADFYELFENALRDPKGPGLLVRAKNNRQLEDEQERLFETAMALPVAGHVSVPLPRQKDRPARLARLAIRYATVTLRPPKDKAKLPALTVQIVLAQEVDAPQGAEPIDWRLLSTVAVGSLEQACQVVAWYTERWGIEVFHRVLKSGCKVEARQLGHGERLQTCLAIDMVVAWRIHYMTLLGREVPDMPCDVVFGEAEWKALLAHSTKNPIAPEQAPPLQEAVRMLGKVGGFLGRKCDGQPGAETLWRGLMVVSFMADVWRVMASP
jgi:hypothetical protein